MELITTGDRLDNPDHQEHVTLADEGLIILGSGIEGLKV